MKNLRKTSSGFTLTEILVVVMILGVLASIALPSFRSLVVSQQVKNASFELFSSLSLARSEAIKRNSIVTITGVAYPSNEFGWVITSSGGETIRTQGPLKGIVITTAGAGITYTRNGRATTAATFQIDSSAVPTVNVRCIRIEPSGMPRTTKGVC